MAKIRFTNPKSRPAFTVARIEPTLTIDTEAKTVSGFYSLAAVDDAWLQSQDFTFALADLDFRAATVGTGSILARLERAILAQLVATGAVNDGTVEDS